MRIVSGHVLVASVVAALVLAGCSAPDPLGSPYKGGKAKGSSSSSSSSSGEANPEGEDPGSTSGGDPAAPAPTTAPTTPPTTPPVVEEFCDDGKTIPGTKVLDDTLATEKGFFTVADGFAQASWTFDGVALRQARLIDDADTLVFNRDATIGDVLIEVRSSSTEVSSAITPRLRQMFILVGTAVTAGVMTAVGCGVEVVQGQTVEQKTSVVRFAGSPGNVATTPIERVNRAPLQANEEFGMKARLSKGTLTCEVTQAATTTATATNIGPLTGSVGFFTRQTKALFKNARICKLK